MLQVPTKYSIEGLKEFNRLPEDNFIYPVRCRIFIEHLLSFLGVLQDLTKYFQGTLKVDTRSYR